MSGPKSVHDGRGEALGRGSEKDDMVSIRSILSVGAVMYRCDVLVRLML